MKFSPYIVTLCAGLAACACLCLLLSGCAQRKPRATPHAATQSASFAFSGTPTPARVPTLTPSETAPTEPPVTAPPATETLRPDAARLAAYDLVDLSELCPDWIPDVRYATENNFTAHTIYPLPFCLLHKNTAQKLLQAQSMLWEQGYTLRIYDAYRPHRYQTVLYDAAPDKNYVAKPENISRHNRACAVDVTLVDRETGENVAMPSGFDDLSWRAHRDRDFPEPIKTNLRILTEAMTRAGFRTIRTEWWHYDDTEYLAYPNLDVDFPELCETGDM